MTHFKYARLEEDNKSDLELFNKQKFIEGVVG